MAATNSLIQSAFQAAMDEFKTNLDNDKLYAEILAVKSIDEVYDLTDKLQAEQGKKGQLRHLAKIEPFLNRLREYAGVIEVFLQVQPDIMALIWGPIKLLLQWSSVLTQSFDAIVSAAGDIGLLLPEFQEVTVLFSQNTRLYDVLVLFFKDILDFYQVGLKFFSMARWKYFFEALWPRKRDYINMVKTHIERHTLLMRNEVRLEHIREEHEARLKALEHFKATERSHQLQQYHAIKTDFNPRTYGDKLNWYRGRVCKGTGTWLLREDAFKKWTDVANTGPRVLWIQGIPGAGLYLPISVLVVADGASGKTFLAGTAIDQAQAIGLTAFAFLTHNLISSTSALTVLHSLMFQLAGQNEGLQGVICHSVHEHTKSDIKLTTALLKSLLNCVGPVFFIIDGVDEIDMVERRILLQHLLDLSRDCTAMRLLISSRREDDIVAMLESNSESVRVNERNKESIQAYVDDQVKHLFASNGFPSGLRDKFTQSMSGLATQAKGMFLYVRIVLDGIDMLSDVSEIHDYMTVLPQSLDEAYKRVITRIKKLRQPLRDKAWKILGWVGCSPTPLTSQELAHALAIQPESLEPARATYVAPNLGMLCGPIVEIVDGYVQFVHFTVKEYLFTPDEDIPAHISLADATLDLANRCITLLCQRHYDPGVVDDDAQFASMMLNGCYNLHYFATNHWLALIENYIGLVGNVNVSDQLLHHVRLLMCERGNPGYAAEREAFAEPAYLRLFQQNHPDIYKYLLNSSQFRERCSKIGYHVVKDDSWRDLDPLDVVNTSTRLHRKLTNLICPRNSHKANCCCNAVYQCFGTRPLKCGFLLCPFQRHGFESIAELAQHEMSHSRAWKCEVSGCEYEKTGFLSENMRGQHLRKAHRDTAPNANIEQENLTEPEIGPILIDLIKKDQVATAEAVLQGVKLDNMRREDNYRLRWALGKFGSIAMLELFNIPQPEFVTDNPTFLEACERRDPAIIEWLLNHGCGLMRCNTLAMAALIRSTSPEIYTLTRQSIKSELSQGIHKTNSGIYIKSLLWDCFHTDLIAASSRITEREEYLISLWDTFRLDMNFKSRQYSLALSNVARTTCSIPLGQALLKYGARLEKENEAMVSPLCFATRKSSAENAEFVRFLLFAGANPDATDRVDRKRKRKDTKASDGICAREMSRWLGVSWTQLVAQAAEYRKGL
ncbi:uncharacterized protein DSM5745_08598 [Aspergillus mulundensis]|uniref:Uncharacterized protein n=1 Tax=Aspergillus mulundensis TaxID=1810919 RepID=A0A3D8R4E8_9EURO|nr:hypothetical protein DSM5745_08598 [Aspergillus mulundensis]RDW68838.1 hypothetical protein DSM5745_08598 [Aspergillus mulundensis]